LRKIHRPEVTLRQSAAANVPATQGAWQTRWKDNPMIHEYAAIDPMALLFPSRIYISMSEKLHPHVPKSVEIKEALGRLTPEERLYILQRARILAAYKKMMAALLQYQGDDGLWRQLIDHPEAWPETSCSAR